MSDLLVERTGAVTRVTFNRPRKHNAMTWEMSDGPIAASNHQAASQA